MSLAPTPTVHAVAARVEMASHSPLNEHISKQVLLEVERQAHRLFESAEDSSIALGDLYAHGSRTANLAVQIGKVLGLASIDLTLLGLGALLHDIGKALVPTSIREKDGALSVLELTVIRRHTTHGESILRSVFNGQPEIADAIAGIAYSHHERWDGNGYPQGLKGEAIPLLARITAVADVFDALISPRSYKPAWSLDRAINAIVSEREKQFDPRCVDAFIELVSANALVPLSSANDH
jgi:putative two-component system response regulator